MKGIRGSRRWVGREPTATPLSGEESLAHGTALYGRRSDQQVYWGRIEQERLRAIVEAVTGAVWERLRSRSGMTTDR